MKRSVQQVAKSKATKLHAELVRARGACENCGTTQNLQSAHIISRRYSHTRVRLDNAFALCAKDHMRFTEWPLSFASFVNAKIGWSKYDELKRAALSSGKVDWVVEYEKLKEYRDTVPDARTVRAEDL